MSRLPNRILSQNTIIWSTPMTTKSARRSPRRRVNSPSSSFTKTRRIWDNTYNSNTRPPIKRASLPIHHFSPLGYYYNRVNLPSTNRPKITNCLLICKPYGPSSRRDPNPNPVRIFRSNHFNNRPRTSIFSTILPGQHSI